MTRPSATTTNPHSQLDQQPDVLLNQDLLDSAAAMTGVELARSLRAPPGTIGLYAEPGYAKGPSRAFMLEREFAHIDPSPDGSLHLTLPDDVRQAAIDADWAEPHPLAGQPTVSTNIVMIYAPRDDEELEIVCGLLDVSRQFALGTYPT